MYPSLIRRLRMAWEWVPLATTPVKDTAILLNNCRVTRFALLFKVFWPLLLCLTGASGSLDIDFSKSLWNRERSFSSCSGELAMGEASQVRVMWLPCDSCRTLSMHSNWRLKNQSGPTQNEALEWIAQKWSKKCASHMSICSKIEQRVSKVGGGGGGEGVNSILWG